MNPTNEARTFIQETLQGINSFLSLFSPFVAFLFLAPSNQLIHNFATELYLWGKQVARPCRLITFGLPALFSVLQRARNNHLYKTTFFCSKKHFNELERVFSVYLFTILVYHFVKKKA